MPSDGVTHPARDDMTMVSVAEHSSTDDAGRRRRTRGPSPLRRLRFTSRRPQERNGELDALQADALLLREENASLRVKLERSPDAGSVIERVRTVSASLTHGDGEDDAMQLYSEAIVMRNTLMEVCREIGQAMVSLEARLNSLATPDVGSENGHSHNGPAHLRVMEAP
jgi:hypothetical protein